MITMLVLLSSALAVTFLCTTFQPVVAFHQVHHLSSSQQFATSKRNTILKTSSHHHHHHHHEKSSISEHSSTSVQEDDVGFADNSSGSSTTRRRMLSCSFMTISLVVVFNPMNSSRRADAMNNPLNLKGSYWETGELYRKSDNELPTDPDELLTSLIEVATTLESLNDIALEGKFGELSRLLRGGAISESKLRLRGYAIIDMIEDEKQEYIASELFRTFLRDFAILDTTVDAATRQSKIDGGLVETVGLAVVSPFSAANEVARISQEPNFGNDPRINVISALGECTKSLKAFNKLTGDAI